MNITNSDIGGTEKEFLPKSEIQVLQEISAEIGIRPAVAFVLQILSNLNFLYGSLKRFYSMLQGEVSIIGTVRRIMPTDHF